MKLYIMSDCNIFFLRCIIFEMNISKTSQIFTYFLGSQIETLCFNENEYRRIIDSPMLYMKKAKRVLKIAINQLGRNFGDLIAKYYKHMKLLLIKYDIEHRNQ
jgi:hypothetical protein